MSLKYKKWTANSSQYLHICEAYRVSDNAQNPSAHPQAALEDGNSGKHHWQRTSWTEFSKFSPPCCFHYCPELWPAETHLEVFKISPQSSHLSPVSSPKAMASSVLSKFRESQQDWHLHIAQESDTPMATELRVRVYLHCNAPAHQEAGKKPWKQAKPLKFASVCPHSSRV